MEFKHPQIELVEVDSLIPYENNAKLHNEDQVNRLVKLIQEFGYTNPVLAEGLNLVAGHCRQKAVQRIYEAGGKVKLPNQQELPTGTILKIDCTGWSSAQKKLTSLLITNQRKY